MTDRQNSRLSLAVEANRKLWEQALSDFDSSALTIGIVAHDEIERTPFTNKCKVFYRHYFPLHEKLVDLLADTYRSYFKLGLAHPREVGPDPHRWVTIQLQPAVETGLQWIQDWHILACEGENQQIRRVASLACVPGETVSVSVPTAVPLLPPKSWRAPAWLFHNYPIAGGVALIKTEHVPPTDFEGRLGEAHTRLLLKWARQFFVGALRTAVETVWNKEMAAAAAIPAQAVIGEKRGPNKRKGWEQRLKLYDAIRKVLGVNPSLQGMEFCAELDKRHAPPLYDWTKHGEWRQGLTWKEAWGDPHLRDKIRRVRQEAMKSR
jgi:hypothetical protein